MPEMIDKEVTLLLLNTAIKQFGENWLQDKMTKNGLLIAKQIVSKQPAVNHWIPVEDALPEIKEFHISDTVLCYCDSGALAIARLESNGFGQVGFNCEKDDEYHHSAGKVLYWMPIPDIPEPLMEVENENR